MIPRTPDFAAFFADLAEFAREHPDDPRIEFVYCVAAIAQYVADTPIGPDLWHRVSRFTADHPDVFGDFHAN